MEILKSDFVKYQTLVGKDGWHYIWNMDGITEIISGKTNHDRGQLEMETRNIELRESWCAQRNITYVHTIAPDKSSIYPEFLPDEVHYEPNGLLFNFSEALLEKDVTFVDLRETLAELKKDAQVYFKTDSHWSYETAYEVYLRIMQPVFSRLPKVKIVTLDQVRRKERNKIMELAAIGDNPSPESFLQLEPSKKSSKCVFQTNSARGRIQVFENENTDLPKAIVFRDSFTSFFLPFLCESFSRVVVLNSRVFWFELVESEKPDVVIMEVAERYLDPVVTDLGRKSFFETFDVEISTILESGEQK